MQRNTERKCQQILYNTTIPFSEIVPFQQFTLLEFTSISDSSAKKNEIFTIIPSFIYSSTAQIRHFHSKKKEWTKWNKIK